jgi:formylglycine-generating enzyme required for sulfatase activity
VIGDGEGEADEQPVGKVVIERDFWMGACEITNEQYRLFDPTHTSGLFAKRYQGPDGPGLSLDEKEGPVVRVSWDQAMEFCEWLSEKTEMPFTLPTEAQWEYTCRAGTGTAVWYGRLETDFSRNANLADKALSVPPRPTGGLDSSITSHFGRGIFMSALRGGNILCEARFDDGVVGTAQVGQYRPNHWGLYDMCGNVCEWTRSVYKAYLYREDDGRHYRGGMGKRVVRGGSWCDRPERARSAFRLGYQPFYRVHNVGFRVVMDKR